MSLKLKSKLTGIVGELRYDAGEDEPIRVVIKESGSVFGYKTLGGVLNDWTEFIVRTPLIEDENDPERAEKIRRIIREWAEVLHINQDNIAVSFGAHRTAITGWQDGLVGGYSIDIPSGFKGLRDEMRTTITELCGEGEE